MNEKDNSESPVYGYHESLLGSDQPEQKEEEFSWSDFFLEKFWIWSGIAALAVSLFAAKQLNGFLMFSLFLFGSFVGLLAVPSVLASVVAIVPALIISSGRQGKSFGKAFKPIFTAMLFVFWLVCLVAWCVRLISLRR